jgi:hypothetical protein
MSNTLIFISNTKIFLYDYITDAIKEINDKEMDQKGIKKVIIIRIRYVPILKPKYVSA